MRYVTNARNELVAISRSGEVVIHDDNGRERERHKAPYGATLLIRDGEVVKGRTGPGYLGSAYSPYYYRVCRQGPFRECGRRRNGRKADRRDDRIVHACGNRSKTAGRGANQGLAPDGEASGRR